MKILQTIVLITLVFFSGVGTGCKKYNPDARRFKTGDLVQLKSGGPRMVVSSYVFGDVFVRWVDDFGQDHACRYGEDILEAVNKK